MQTKEMFQNSNKKGGAPYPIRKLNLLSRHLTRKRMHTSTTH